MTSEHQRTPREALSLLKAGNHRFIGGLPEHPRQDFTHLRELARRDPRPFALVLSCADSRLPLEIMFDCGFGDLFCVRTAGGTFSPAVLSAVDFAMSTVQPPLLLVLGHTDCRAIAAVVAGQSLTNTIDAGLTTIRKAAADLAGAHTADQLAAVTIANVWLTIDRIVEQSLYIPGLLASGQLGIAAALANTATAKLTWLERTAR